MTNKLLQVVAIQGYSSLITLSKFGVKINSAGFFKASHI